MHPATRRNPAPEGRGGPGTRTQPKIGRTSRRLGQRQVIHHARRSSRRVPPTRLDNQRRAEVPEPRRPGERRKHARKDAEELARLYRAGELVTIRVPTEREERVRDLGACAAEAQWM